MHAIRTRPRTYFTGKTTDGKQVLLGWVSDFVGVIFFDDMGKIIETREYSLGIDITKGFGPAVEARAKEEIKAIRKQFGVSRGQIKVQPFFIPKWQVELKLFPDDLQDYLDHPDSVAEEDLPIYRTDIERWIANQNYVLKWGNDYYLDKEGNTI
jgi:hypothetical protein